MIIHRVYLTLPVHSSSTAFCHAVHIVEQGLQASNQRWVLAGNTPDQLPARAMMTNHTDRQMWNEPALSKHRCC